MTGRFYLTPRAQLLKAFGIARGLITGPVDCLFRRATGLIEAHLKPRMKLHVAIQRACRTSVVAHRDQ